MERLSDVEQKLSEAKKQQTELKTQLAESAENLTKTKADYEDKVRSGAAESELDDLDAALYKAERERVRIEIRLTQCGAEIEQLQHEREEAHAEAERAAYDADVAAALSEAREIEATVQVLIASAAVHAARLERMRRYAEGVGVAQIPFRLANLERRVTTIFAGNHSMNKVYQKPYPEILKSNIESVERQITRSAPATEEKLAEREAEQQSAVNN